jgi:hypothetical protein
MFLVRKISLLALLALVVAIPASAQQQADQASEGPKYYAFGSAGAAFAAQTGATFAAEYGERLRRFNVFVNYAYYDDLMTDEMHDDLDLIGSLLTSATGNTRTFSGRDRGLAFTAGTKFLLTRGKMQPYVGGGAGVLHIHRKITEASLGDVTQSFPAVDGVVDPVTAEGFKPLAEVIVGFQGLAGRHTFFDVSYRYRQAFQAESLSFSQFSAGLGVGF